jgi:putative redox protein
MDKKEMLITFPGGVRVDAAYKGFTIQTDQPTYEGGGGTAPAPFDLFLASLGTCAGFYVFVFCRQRGIPVDKVSLVMRMTKGAESKMLEKISIEIQLPPDFPEKYKTAVIRAADTCAVKAHIAKPPLFEIVAKIG